MRGNPGVHVRLVELGTVLGQKFETNSNFSLISHLKGLKNSLFKSNAIYYFTVKYFL